MSATEFYARKFGIADIDVAEASWLEGWIKRHANSLNYDTVNFRWHWVSA